MGFLSKIRNISHSGPIIVGEKYIHDILVSMRLVFKRNIIVDNNMYDFYLVDYHIYIKFDRKYDLQNSIKNSNLCYCMRKQITTFLRIHENDVNIIEECIKFSIKYVNFYNGVLFSSNYSYKEIIKNWNIYDSIFIN
jgi:hypothetical protein